MTLSVSEDASLAGTGLPDHFPQRAAGAYAFASYPTQVSFPYTGDYRIDTLLQGADGESGPGALVYQWNAGRTLGSPVEVSYSFAAIAPTYGGNVDASTGDSGFEAFTPQQMTAVDDIMSKLSQELGITLFWKADSSGDYGQIRFGNNYQQYSTGYSWLPYQEGDRGGDVWIDITPEPPLNANLRDLAPGSEGYATLLHEIGHALGLKHPGDYNAGSAASGAPGNYLASAEDNSNNTVMTYDLYNQPLPPRDWFGMYDLLALKALYGSGNYNAGDTVYSYTDATGLLLKIVDDGSGFDTIDISGVSSLGSRVVDMRPGSFSSVGRASSQAASLNVSIDFSTVVEKFVGTVHGDTVTGNDANNVFVLGAGSNVADGGAGLDLVQYDGSRDAYQGSGTGSGIQVTGNGVSDVLMNVERLAFSDSKLALDLGGNAGLAAKILGAVFDFDAPMVRNAPDSVGLALAKVDSGMSYTDLMTLALDMRLGAGRTNEQVVDLLYGNVVGASPSAEQSAPFLGQLQSGAQTQAGLAIFAAETAENAAQIDLVGLGHTGITYV